MSLTPCERDEVGIPVIATCRRGHTWAAVYIDVAESECKHCGNHVKAHRKVTPEKCRICSLRYDTIERRR